MTPGASHECSRRAALAAIGGAAVLPLIASAAGVPAPVSRPQGAAQNPGQNPADGGATGRVLPGLQGIDDVVLPILDAHSMVGAAVAIAQGGKLKVARGYGFADFQSRAPLLPNTPFVLASVSKVPTAQTVLKLVEQGKLNLTDRVFSFFTEIPPPPGRREDPRLNEITLEMCLWHTGGWNRKETPLATPIQVQRALRLEHPPTPDQMIRYMKGQPLNFAPGTQQVYSNFGFVLLGAVIAKVMRAPYPEFVEQNTLHPMGITSMRIDPAAPEYLPGETHRYTPPMEHAIPGGHPLMTMAAGGWEGSCLDMARFLTAIDGSRTGTPWLSPPTFQKMLSPAPGMQQQGKPWFGLGWDEVQEFDGNRFSYGKEGDLPGIYTWIQHLAIGVDLVILCNTSGEGAKAVLKPKITEFIRAQRSWPDGDLFSELT